MLDGSNPIIDRPAMPRSSPCPICNSTVQAPFAAKNGCTVVRCACGFVFQSPLPSGGDTTALYDDAYTGTTAGYFAKVDKKMRRSRGRARRLRAQVASGSRPRLLDVGANGGFMLEAAREAGFDVQGVELDPRSVAYAHRHYPACPVFHGSVEGYIEQHPSAAGSFDVVYCAEVIEHVPDVNSFVAAIAALMRRDGRLYLTTPDIGHWRRPKDIQCWDAFDPPAHCLYFDRESLGRLLVKHGLRLIRRDIAFKPGLKVMAGRR